MKRRGSFHYRGFWSAVGFLLYHQRPRPRICKGHQYEPTYRGNFCTCDKDGRDL